MRSRHTGQGGDGDVLGPVEDQVLVDLVGDHPRVVLARQRADELELGPAEHLAGGVVRGVEQHQPGAGGEGRPERVLVDGEVGEAQDGGTADRAGQRDRGGVRVVVGLEGHDLVAGLAQGEHHRGDRLGGAGRHEDLPVGVDVEPVEAPLVRRHRRPQLRNARTGRVLVAAAVDRRDGRVEHLARPVGVGKALAEVDRAGARGQGAHLGEDGGAEALHARDQRISHAGQASRTMAARAVCLPSDRDGVARIRAPSHRHLAVTSGCHRRDGSCDSQSRSLPGGTRRRRQARERQSRPPRG